VIGGGMRFMHKIKGVSTFEKQVKFPNVRMVRANVRKEK
jgi:hypothetical protein